MDNSQCGLSLIYARSSSCWKHYFYWACVLWMSFFIVWIIPMMQDGQLCILLVLRWDSLLQSWALAFGSDFLRAAVQQKGYFVSGHFVDMDSDNWLLGSCGQSCYDIPSIYISSRCSTYVSNKELQKRIWGKCPDIWMLRGSAHASHATYWHYLAIVRLQALQWGGRRHGHVIIGISRRSVFWCVCKVHDNLLIKTCTLTCLVEY